MAMHLYAPTPWAAITKAARTKGPRHAAIAYLGEAASDLLPLRRGDVLVVNACDRVLRSHGTSPEALQYFIDRGVRVFSSSTLHAKVLATSRVAVIGSANASYNSVGLDEAVVVTDDPGVIGSVREFIESLEGTTEVDSAFIDRARAEWKKGRVVALPGVAGSPPKEQFPPRTARLFLWAGEDYEFSKAEQDLWDREHRRLAHAASPVAKYRVGWYRVEEQGLLREGDVVVTFDERDGESWLHAPGVVCSPEYPIPRGRGAVGYFLKYRTDLGDVALSDANTRVRALGLGSLRLNPQRQIRSDQWRSALLGLWGI